MNKYQKFQILLILRYLSPRFYTDNVEITGADTGIPQPHKIS